MPFVIGILVLLLIIIMSEEFPIFTSLLTLALLGGLYLAL